MFFRLVIYKFNTFSIIFKIHFQSNIQLVYEENQ